jgi:biotin carboxylase
MSRRADIILLDAHEPTWQKPYLTAWHVVDVTDLGMLERVARPLRAAGVLTYDETLVQLTADLAARLGIPHTDPEAIRRCKDKSALRALLAERGLGAVRFATADDLPAARAAAHRIGYPVVCKPMALGGSIGVMLAHDDDELAEAVAVALGAATGDGVRSRIGGVLLEEYLDGPEFSVDCVTWAGVTYPLVVAEKIVSPPPYFEELGHIVPATPHPDLDDAIRLVLDAHRAAGLDRLVTHSEFKLTSRGPRIIEINVRLGGDLIPYLGLLATGADLASAAADVAVGDPPRLDPAPDAHPAGFAAVHMVYPERSCRLTDVRLGHDSADHPGLDQFTTFLEAGTEVRLPPEGFMSRIAFAVVTGASREECVARRDAVAADVLIDDVPLAAAETV